MNKTTNPKSTSTKPKTTSTKSDPKPSVKKEKKPENELKNENETSLSQNKTLGALYLEPEVKIYAHKTDPKAVIPEVAYGGTSACFDLTCTNTTIIPARGSAKVPNGLNLVIDQSQNYWMQIQLRSTYGFSHDLVPHYGTVDPGYTGEFSVKIYNMGDDDVIIPEGTKYAQVAVIKKPEYGIIELDDKEFKKLEENQKRGSKGFGSSSH